jgi:hypothetical protein
MKGRPIIAGGVMVVAAALFALSGCGGTESDTGADDDRAEDAATSTTDVDGSESVEADTTVPQDETAVDGPAPVGLVAVQGPIEDSARYVSVTWSHVDLALSPDEPARAVGYDVERDGEMIGSTTVDDEPWDDMAYRDDAVSPGTVTYRVRARFAEGAGPWSEPVTTEVRTTADVGPVFAVDDYQGSDLERAQQAVDEAEEAGGGVVVFGPGTYELSDSLLISGNGVLLRGAGTDQTVIRPAFAGGDESCGAVPPLLLFKGDWEELGVAMAETAQRGDTTLILDRPAPLEVGDFVEVDGVEGQFGIDKYGSKGIAQDPSTGRDERYPFDAGIVTAVEGNTITLDHGLSPIITEGSELFRYPEGNGNGVELLTVEGGGPDDTSYYRLIDVTSQIDFRLADVTARWPNRNAIDASGHDITVVNLTAIEGGAAGYQPEPCKYKLGFGPTTDVIVVDSEIGSPDSDENMSLITMQFAYRAMVRNTVLGQSRTYAVNEHGGGSRDLVVENNWIRAGPSGWSGILLGNDTWGFGGETAIRNNQFLDNVVDVLMVENAYGVVVAGNRSQGCRQACVTWSGWGGVHGGEAAVADPADYGSARLAVIGNHLVSSAAGLDLGINESSGFPWTGIRDVWVADNAVEAADGSAAVVIRGDAETSGRVWITGNRFAGPLTLPQPGSDWWLWDNTDAGGSSDSLPETGSEAEPPWISLYQPWEHPGVGS